MKKRKKLICSIITILIFSCFFKAFIDTPKSYTLTEEVYTHRRQSWLKAINWDDNRLEYSGKGIKIAVIDSGVESNVPELKGKIRSELSIIDNTERQKKEAKHGTAVASIISAESHSSEQVMGIACNEELIVIDVTDQKDGIVKVNDLVEGIGEAIRQDVDLINISIGCTSDNRKLRNIIKKAWEKEILIIASAGDFTKNNILYPSKYPETVSVGAMDKNGEIMYPTFFSQKKIVYFPGEKIVSTIGKNVYAGCDGTSFSTAICTGLASLLLEKNNDKIRVKQYLEEIEYTKEIDFIKAIEGFNNE